MNTLKIIMKNVLDYGQTSAFTGCKSRVISCWLQNRSGVASLGIQNRSWVTILHVRNRNPA